MKNKTDKHFWKLIKKRMMVQITNIRNIKRDFTTNLTDTNMIKRGYYKWYFSNRSENLHWKDKSWNFPKLTQEKIENINNPKSSYCTCFFYLLLFSIFIKNLTRLITRSMNSSNILRKKMNYTQILLDNIKNFFSTSFYHTSISPIPKIGKNIFKKKKLQVNLPKNYDYTIFLATELLAKL